MSSLYSPTFVRPLTLRPLRCLRWKHDFIKSKKIRVKHELKGINPVASVQSVKGELNYCLADSVTDLDNCFFDSAVLSLSEMFCCAVSRAVSSTFYFEINHLIIPQENKCKNVFSQTRAGISPLLLLSHEPSVTAQWIIQANFRNTQPPST